MINFIDTLISQIKRLHNCQSSSMVALLPITRQQNILKLLLMSSINIYSSSISNCPILEISYEIYIWGSVISWTSRLSNWKVTLLSSKTNRQLTAVIFWTSCFIKFVIDIHWKQTTIWYSARIYSALQVLFLAEKIITQTNYHLEKYYGDTALSYSMVEKCFFLFRCGRTSSSDAASSRRPTEVTTLDTIVKIYDMV